MIKLLLVDIDGTLTNGKIIYDSQNNEIKTFSVKDGLAITSWLRLNRHIAIITGRTSSIITQRAEELNIQWVFQGVQDKGVIVRDLCQKQGFKKEEIAAIGDDLNDIKMFQEASLNFAPQDCSPLIIPYIHYHLHQKGGDGALREAIEIILRQEGCLNDFLALWK